MLGTAFSCERTTPIYIIFERNKSNDRNALHRYRPVLSRAATFYRVMIRVMASDIETSALYYGLLVNECLCYS